MSVSLQSQNNEIGENIANGSWTRTVQLGRAYFGGRIRKWDGCHNPQSWTPEECTLMAEAMEMAFKGEFNDHVDAEDRDNIGSPEWMFWIASAVTYMPGILKSLAENGGAKLY